MLERTHGRTSRRFACAPGLSGRMQRNSRLAGAEDILRAWKARIDFLGTREGLIDAEGQEEKKCDGGTRRNGCRAWGKAGTLL